MSELDNKPRVLKKQAQWRVYKPKKDHKGAASRLELKIITTPKMSGDNQFTDREVQVFWVASPQTGVDSNDNAMFSWKDKDDKLSVTLKLGEPDIGDLLAVLTGQKKAVGTGKGIYHQNERGNTSFTFELVEGSGYKVRVAKMVGGKLTAVAHTISLGEAQVLRVLLESIIRQTYLW